MEEVNGLAARIQAIVEPEVWGKSGGTSYVHVVDQAIVVNATEGQHQRIGALLNERGIAGSPVAGSPLGNGNNNSNNNGR